jgi:hypothetical protein
MIKISRPIKGDTHRAKRLEQNSFNCRGVRLHLDVLGTQNVTAHKASMIATGWLSRLNKMLCAVQILQYHVTVAIMPSLN